MAELGKEMDSDTIEHDHVLSVYDAIAEHFSTTRYKAWPRVRSFVESLAPYALIADVGCGNGKYFPCAQRHTDGAAACRYVIGVDSSMGLLRLAQQQREERQEWNRHGPDTNRSHERDNHPKKQRKKRSDMNEEEEEGGEEANGCVHTTCGGDGPCSNATHADDSGDAPFVPRTDLVRSDGRHTSLRGGLFDAAISIAVVHHFAASARRAEAVAELLRLVRPNGGRILISVWAKEQPKKRSRDDVADVLIPWEVHERYDATRRVYQRYYHLFEKGELEALVEEAASSAGILVHVQESYYDKENWCVILERT